MKAQTLTRSQIRVPEWAERPASKVEDEHLQNAIEQGGIQQPLVVLPDGKKFLLVDGLRRLRIAETLDIGKVPVVIDEVPAGEDPDEYGRRIRFVLDQHRQDLLPTQRAELIETLKTRFGMSHRTVAAYLGVVPDSITNWLAVKTYIEPVRALIDSEKLTMQAARVFDGMTEEGQTRVWSKHSKDLIESGRTAHKQLRKQYGPTKHPDLYRDAEKTAAGLNRVKGRGKTVQRKPLDTDEKRRLSASLELREIELRESTAEAERLKAECITAGPIAAAILRDEELRAMVPAEMLPELERFSEIY